MTIRFNLLLICLMGGATGQAAADDNKDRGFYFGVESGLAQHNLNADRFNANFAVEDPSATRVDDERFGFAVYAGYRIFKYLSVDGGYIDLGEAEVEIGYHAGLSCTGTVCAPTRAPPRRFAQGSENGVRVRATGSWPFTPRWSVDVRGGFALIAGGDSSSVVGIGGVGTTVGVTPAIRLRLFWDQLDKRSRDGEPLDFYSLGAVMQF